jgi:hypothetical protein
MADITPIQSALSKADAFNPAVDNPAVARCCAAYASAEQAAKDKGKGEIYSALMAIKAFRKALPPLAGNQNISDFIACVAHGLLIGAFDGANAARLLYAAQVAHTADRRSSASPKSAAA